MESKVIKIGSRASKLAVIQSRMIMDRIKDIFPKVKLELVTLTTTGDKILDKTLDQIGGKGLFLKELDEALLDRRADICVHSLKDVPVEEDPELPIGAYFGGEYPGDVLVLPKGKTDINKDLAVGCSSSRRTLQFQKLYPDLTVKPIRGNVLTRLEKLDRGEFGGLILAEAGLVRLGLEDRISYRFSYDEIIPAAGQGIIAVQSRKGEFRELLSKLNEPEAQLRAKTERLLSQKLGGDCSSPIGCFAEFEKDEILLRGFYGSGEISKSESVKGSKKDAFTLAEILADKLKK